MAALDFPASPLIGDKYPVPAVVGQPQYTFDGVKWTTVGAQVTTAAPASALPLMDQLTALVGTTTKYAREDHVHPINTSLLVKKNYIINGAMQISQENGTLPLGAVGQHPADMFMYTGVNTAAGVAFGQVQAGTPGGSSHRIRLTVAYTVDATQDAGDFAAFQTAIEGNRYIALWQPVPKQITLRFGVKAPAGTYCVAFRNFNTTRSYVAEYTIAAGEANTDVVKTITLTADSGTNNWDFGIATGVFITWAFMCGSTYRTTPGAWTTGNFMGSANQTNFMGTLNNVFELFDVSLTEGTVAPPFVVPDYVSELALCQRYYFKRLSGLYGYVPNVGGFAIDAIYFPVTMRTNPTLLATGGTALSSNGVITFDSHTPASARMYTTSTAAGAIGVENFTMTGSARL